MLRERASSGSGGPRALIVSVQAFQCPATFPSRRGAATDTRNLHRALCRLGFTVVFKTDYTAGEIMHEFRRESCRKHGSCFLSVLSSHGEDGVIYGADGNPVRLRDIFSMFGAESCPSLAGKPKIFFVQACRGSQQDEGVLVEAAPEIETDGCDSQQNFFSHYLTVPEDTVVHFSSCPNYCSFLRPTGSTFLQTLCKVLCGEQRHWELLRIMTRVNCLVALTFESRGQHGGKKQMPCFVTKLRQEVYLSAESKASCTEPSLFQSKNSISKV